MKTITFPCPFCDFAAPSGRSLGQHKRRKHTVEERMRAINGEATATVLDHIDAAIGVLNARKDALADILATRDKVVAEYQLVSGQLDTLLHIHAAMVNAQEPPSPPSISGASGPPAGGARER